ncbi:MAG: glutamate-1-semialdehyde-2,1-aminomutase [Porphyromonadaceae bacterium CG2_30_38_12]|nr:MAG: glutamate-1-semialdehyde-2,1-aminomutase [Porphyromonadaceae bacterium CG2_30_38_12]
MQRILSEKAYNEAVEYIPGGVNSPVRALRSVGVAPLFVQSAYEDMFTDIDGHQYIDFCLSWGVFILGHGNKKVNASAINAIANGSSFGIPTLVETELAKMVVQAVPSIEKVRFVSSGTEAVMSALRLARGFTGRRIVIKFDGCYHGHSDSMLVSAGSGVAQLGQSSSAGVPAEFAKLTISLPFNDLNAVKSVFARQGNAIAAIILEPVPANMGVIIPQTGFLEGLREITTHYGALLIFDEVISGFRLGLGGAQEIWQVIPDLTTIGKIVGGGFPAAAFGGKKEIMDQLAPLGSVYQAGTLSGNPVAMHAGIETIKQLLEPGFYTQLEQKTTAFVAELCKLTKNKGIVIQQMGSMFTLFFSQHELKNYDDVKKIDTARFSIFFQKLVAQGVYFSPSPFEANFISITHTDAHLNHTLKAVESALRN